jgi:hypothetical protein
MMSTCMPCPGGCCIPCSARSSSMQHACRQLHPLAACPLQVVPLTDADLKRYAQQHGIIIEFMANSKPISDPDTVKSLVFMANGQPVMVVVAGEGQRSSASLAPVLPSSIDTTVSLPSWLWCP